MNTDTIPLPEASQPFRLWQNATIVRAEKIIDIKPENPDRKGERLIICGEGDNPPILAVDSAFIQRVNPQPGLYLVAHPGGEFSVLPAGTFEESFTLVNEEQKANVAELIAEIGRLSDLCKVREADCTRLMAENSKLHSSLDQSIATNKEIIARLDAATQPKPPAENPIHGQPVTEDYPVVLSIEEADAWFRENHTGRVICEAANKMRFVAETFPDAKAHFELNA